MVKAADLIPLFWEAINCGGGYIWGRYGQTWTAANQRAATREQTVKWGAQWIGHRVWDCSGLGYWAFKELGGFIYHGSNTIWKQYVCRKSDLKNGKRTDGQPMYPGDPVFLKRVENGQMNRHHIGYYVGGDTVIEAKGTQAGVVTSSLSRWHETAHWYDVEYENGVIFLTHPILRKGASGDAVVELQTLLNQYGYVLTVDAKFGAKTEEAVKDYQRNHGLVADGIVGAATWDSLIPEPTPTPEDPVIVERNTLAGWRRTLQTVAGEIDKALEG